LPALHARLFPLLCVAALALGGCEATKSRPEFSERLKVVHANGETLVPGRSEYVVALDADTLDATLALGARPVGEATPVAGRRLPRYLGDRLGAVAPVGPPWNVKVAEVARQEPDVILGNRRRHGPIYRRLKEIAATVTSEDAGGGDWKLDFRLYGEALGRPDAAERLLDGYDRRVARLRRQLPRGTEVSLLRTSHGGVRAYGANSFAGTILEDAGLRVVPWRDADAILVARAPGDGDTYRRLVSGPRWRAGRVHLVRDDTWMVGQGMLAARLVTADLRRLLGR
jgi:iron complex transport system substrate-binding protein